MNGEEVTSDSAFDLSAGALCLDFVNTWEDRDRPETERLHDYGDLIAFGRAAGFLQPDDAASLEQCAAAAPEEAAATFQSAIELREVFYRTFATLATGSSAPAPDLQALNRILPEALCCLRVEADGSGFSWSREVDAERLDSPLSPIAVSAAELLTSEALPRVRECDGHSCTWLFLDRSRNRSRRWCSMATCGNRAKARRHYRRTQNA